MEQLLQVSPELDGNQFQLEIRRLAEVLDLGADPSRYRGTGVDYLQSRPYADGDPIQSVDWRVTARSGRLHVKEYESLRGVPLYLVVDRSASMCVGSMELHKYAWAVRLAGSLALAALRQMRPVGLVARGTRPLYYPAGRRSGEVRQWIHELRRYTLEDTTSLGESLAFVEEVITAQSLLVILSDLHDPGVLDALKRLAQMHECVVLHLQDPAETGGLRAGFLRAREAETGRSFLAHAGSRWFERNGMARDIASFGVDYVHLNINEPIVPVVAGLLRTRLSRGRRA